jgi:hypothetical protein
MMSHAERSHPSDPEATMTTVETALGSLATAQLGPTFRAAGVTADQIEQMLVRNSRAIFEAVG